MLTTVVGVLSTALLGVIGWAFNLHSRVSVLEALLNVTLENITARLERIERKLDKE